MFFFFKLFTTNNIMSIQFMKEYDAEIPLIFAFWIGLKHQKLIESGMMVDFSSASPDSYKGLSIWNIV